MKTDNVIFRHVNQEHFPTDCCKSGKFYVCKAKQEVWQIPKKKYHLCIFVRKITGVVFLYPFTNISCMI